MAKRDTESQEHFDVVMQIAMREGFGHVIEWLRDEWVNRLMEDNISAFAASMSVRDSLRQIADGRG